MREEVLEGVEGVGRGTKRQEHGGGKESNIDRIDVWTKQTQH